MFALQQEYGLRLIKDLVQDTNLSRIYGFIFYSKNDTFVEKVLSDDFYWNKLDELSGHRWPIFAAKPVGGHNKQVFSLANHRTTDFLVQSDCDPFIRGQLLVDFCLDAPKDLPCFVAFMWDDNDELQRMSIPIRGKGESEVYLYLEKIVTAITKAEELIEPQYKRNVEVFRNVKTELEAIKFQYYFSSRGIIGVKFAEFFASFI